METIRQLLSRIRWDEEFGRNGFEIGIYDRVAGAVEFHPLEALHLEKGNRFSFTLHTDGEVLSISFHRIRVVRKSGKSIWQRP